ncbi:DNA-binding protein [Bartonella vinsonii]|uniref:DNA-binding protein n=1 Tax=Bartonella vinsonii TaxID=33047 RepID=UPI00034A69E3|nr:DNA-binding protein [Bartonella vinsonii]
MKEWFSIAELAEAALPGLPKSKGGLRKILASTWRHQSELIRKVQGVSRPIVEVHIFLLPEGAKAALLVRYGVGVDAKPMQGEQKTNIWVHKRGRERSIFMAIVTGRVR